MNTSGLTERLLRRDRAVLLSLMGVLFLLAGLYTVLGGGMNLTALQMTSMRGMGDMPGPNAPGAWSLGYALLVFLMWWVMMAAMMLPSVSPTVLLYSALLRRGSEADHVPVISALFLVGYLASWAAFSLVAASSHWALEEMGVVSPTMMTLTDTVPGAIVIILAGLFQFSSLKKTCLDHCRSPAKFLTERRRSGAFGAFRMGLEHGTYCLGCCWFLMALLFVGGVMNLYWIVGLAAFVAIEKLTPFGDRIAKLAGGGLIVWGAFVLASAVW